MCTYRILHISENDKWIFVICNEEDSINEYEPFIVLLKSIAQKWNNGEWEGKIILEGETRYRINNDPLNLVYQWDDLFGIVFDYKNNTNLDDVKSFIADNYNIC